MRAGYWNIVAQVSLEQMIGNLCGHRRCSPVRMALHVSYKSLMGWCDIRSLRLSPHRRERISRLLDGGLHQQGICRRRPPPAASYRPHLSFDRRPIWPKHRRGPSGNRGGFDFPGAGRWAQGQGRNHRARSAAHLQARDRKDRADRDQYTSGCSVPAFNDDATREGMIPLNFLSLGNRLAIRSRHSASCAQGSASQIRATCRTGSFRPSTNRCVQCSLLTLVIAGFSLISQCTHRAPAAF